MSDEQAERPKFPMIFPLKDSPEHEERTAGTIVKHDDISLGDLLMIVTSAAVKLDITQAGPKITRVDNDPSYNGVCLVLAYCFPFIAIRALTGPMKNEKVALDVRRHKMIKVSKHFARAMKKLPKKPTFEGGVVMGGNVPADAMAQITHALNESGWAVQGNPAPNMDPQPTEETFFPPDALPPPDEEMDDEIPMDGNDY